MRRRIGVSQNNNLQADSLEINNGLTASLKFTYDGVSDVTFILPDADGLDGWALKTDGAGRLSFGTVSSEGGATPSLQQVTNVGNTTSNNIQFGTGAGIFLNNGSILREGTIDAGNGGTKGIAQICSVGYELKWEAGRLYVMNNNGNAIRQTIYNFTASPGVNDDNTKGYYVGSLWTTDDMYTVVCEDDSTGAASWVPYDNPLRYVSENVDPVNGMVNIAPTYAVNITSTNLNLNTGGALSINSAYTLPLYDGNPGDVLTTDGAGQADWVVVSSTSGTSGVSGATGSTGATGSNGSSGSSGSSGVSGSSGSSGSSGINGSTGPTGVTGSNGSSGSSGSSGVSGSSGINGSVNATGTTNYIAKFTGATALGDSTVIDNGTQVLLVNNGSTATPSIAFNNSLGTGLSTASNELRISAQGTLVQQISSTTTRFINGTTASPGISFLSDATTGFSRSSSSQINVSVGGSEVSRFIPAGILNINGSQGVPSIAFINSQTTGIYRAGTNIMGFSSGGVLKFTIAPTYIHSVNPHWFSDGSVSAPAMTFNSDTTTGFYRVGSGQIGISTGGATSAIFSTQSTQFLDGSISTPSITFISDTDTGLYRPSANEIGFSTNGIRALWISSNSTLFRDGSVSFPSITFQLDNDTGLYRPGANSMAIVTGGITNSVFGTTNSISAQTFFDKAVNHTPTTNASVTGTYSLDMSASNIFILTLTGNTVLTTTNRNVGSYMVYIKQDGTGGRTFALSGNAEFLGATAISIGTASNAVSILQLVCVGTQSIATSQKNLTNL